MNVPQKRINVTLPPHHVSTTLVTILVTLALVAMGFSKLTKMTKHATT